MAETVEATSSLNSKPRSRRRNSTNPSCLSFTACFGTSVGVTEPYEKNPPEGFKSRGRKKSLSWFSWSRLRIKKSATKTVPVDSSNNKELQQRDSGDIVDWKSTIVEKNPEKTVVIDQSEIQKAKKEKQGNFHNTILEYRAKVDAISDTSPKSIVIGRKIEPPNSGSQSTSPIHNPNRSKLLMNCQSLPPISFNGRKLTALVGSFKTQAKKPASQGKSPTGKFDPMAGLLVLVVALALLLICGRVCAILCTSLWFYAVPRLIATKSDDGAAANGPISELPDFNSEAYKKKVILEGWLERNHRHAGAGVGVHVSQSP
ncbi:uncharacterized protein At5g23160-like [Macadamia integrifolia]|uniref:uncharacterized protein At5g23160-like n=1 Tax=Macadamia integrifolia TaxID=60698 RepID=UPI001C4E5001|nr:uncharacterized protein At5g23160-like [Macadamia integrifolia]